MQLEGDRLSYDVTSVCEGSLACCESWDTSAHQCDRCCLREDGEQQKHQQHQCSVCSERLHCIISRAGQLGSEVPPYDCVQQQLCCSDINSLVGMQAGSYDTTTELCCSFGNLGECDTMQNRTTSEAALRLECYIKVQIYNHLINKVFIRESLYVIKRILLVKLCAFIYPQVQPLYI